jgi:trans-AT polyketide synthase/acyltransferase/oxidoreductase domain-containing protein
VSVDAGLPSAVASSTPPAVTAADAVQRPRAPLLVLRHREHQQVTLAFAKSPCDVAGELRGGGPQEVIGYLPAIYPEWLGDAGFCQAHHVRFCYVSGAMANGIATTRLVVAMARHQMLGVFGAAGLSLSQVEAAIDTIEKELGREGPSWATNLIHSPADPELESALADLYIRRDVRRVCVSAYMALTPAVVRCACAGLRLSPDGRVERRLQLIATVSRPEVATHFLSPAPADMLHALLDSGALTPTEAMLAAKVPLADDITVEADSGGHTDNRPLLAVLPLIATLRDRLSTKYGYECPVRIGAAGGLGHPAAVASAFTAGAAYVLTGSINQCTVESGLSDVAKEMLLDAGVADVAMAAAADMFELGVKVQVLSRGTLFAPRANRLYQIYVAYPDLDALPEAIRTELEQRIFGAPIADVWRETASYWRARRPDEIKRAEHDPKHRMALVFRWYLGKSSRWAIEGNVNRRTDFQIWCGPAMGVCNDWLRGSALEPLEHRSAPQLALNLLEGAAVATRAQQLRSHGIPVSASDIRFTPRRLRVR